ncbi:MAG: tetratricopeptide repeat protein [Candidatus Obscuribacterales bacterium]|jgi:tetratricopeptide (TPR) repeat protein
MNELIALSVIVVALLGLTSCASLTEALYEPPKIVPEGKTPDEYYKMGVNYKLVGWPQQAREALSRAVKADPNGKAGKNASVYLTAYLPLKSQPQVAIDQNIMAFNQMVSGKDSEAIVAFNECIAKYPDFEWPYGNLASIYTKVGRFKEAQDTVQKSLNFNPNYLNGWLHLARAFSGDGDKVAAMRCVKRALEIDPNSDDAKQLEKFLEQ